jgi:hypothetical protein
MSDTHEFFYIDRPAVPATQQVLIDPSALLTSAVLIDAAAICPDSYLFASEIKSESGEVHGTILYAPDQTFAQIMGPCKHDELALVEEEDVEDSVEE